MDLGALLVLLKLAGDTGFAVSPKTEPTPPTSKAGLDLLADQGRKQSYKMTNGFVYPNSING